jgi:outer membrane protein assembly factor BamB
MRWMWVAGAVVLASVVSMAAAADWPQYRGPGHDGITPEKIATNWKAQPPKVVWSIPLGSSLGSISSGGGKLYVFVKQDEDEAAVALDPATGKQLWATVIDKTIIDKDGGDGPRSTPAFVDGKVYVLGTYQKLACVNAADGKVIWKHDLNDEFGGKEPGWGSAASPLVDGNLVFACCGGDNQSLLAFNKDTGALVWQGTSEKPTHAAPIVATIAGARQVIFYTQFGLVSVEAATGKALWKQKFQYNVSSAASPVMCGDDLVYVSAGYGSGSGAYQITQAAGKWTSTELWRRHGNKALNHWSTPVYQDGYIYGLYGFKEFKTEPLKCLDSKSGKEIWSQDGFGQGQVIMVGGNLLVQTDFGDLVLVKADKGSYQEIARIHPFEGEPKCWTEATVANGRIYARSQTGALCIDVSLLATGRAD